ncbi:unnamed protein product [Soboliphyme baturini]|uniref:PlsC domain-containing protein n=1 Tax=Soboliphyme baturini TaxID=241478 RepID=A0A183IPK2_9BILA|nr:unnamed protein product [Soboliphyme baturini]
MLLSFRNLLVIFFTPSLVYIFGDDLDKYRNERCLVIVNHQSTADVPLLVTLFSVKRPGVSSTLWILDSMFKWTNFGLISQIHGDFFIRESTNDGRYSTDQLRKHLENKYWSRDRRWIVLFPEGGFLYKRRTKSQLFALKNNYPVLENVTLPRIGAAKAILDVCAKQSKRREFSNDHVLNALFLKDICVPHLLFRSDPRPPLTYLIDLTLGYSAGMPLSLFNIISCSQRHSRIELHCRVHPISEIQFEQDADLLHYMYDRWVQKEELLTQFYEKGSFAEVSHEAGTELKINVFDVVLSQLVIFTVPMIYFLILKHLYITVQKVLLF